MIQQKKTVEVPPSVGASGLLIAARTYFADRFTPSTEHIRLPEFQMPTGTIEFRLELDATLARGNISRRGRLRNLIFARKFHAIRKSEVVVDFTRYSPANWAHTLDFYIPLFLFFRNELKSYDQSLRLVALLPGEIPEHIKKTFDLLDLPYIANDRIVKGSILRFELSSFHCIRGFARDWLQNFLFDEPGFIEHFIDKEPSHHQRKLFISRRGGRALKNEAEIQRILSDRGFAKVYAEDLSPEDQIRSFLHCDAVAAVHGAAMAPLLYRQRDSTRLKLVEIFNPGHMTNFYRGMAGQVNCDWIGVRGRIEAKWVNASYDFKRQFTKFSLSQFSVDPTSLTDALAQLDLNE